MGFVLPSQIGQKAATRVTKLPRRPTIGAGVIAGSTSRDRGAPERLSASLPGMIQFAAETPVRSLETPVAIADRAIQGVTGVSPVDQVAKFFDKTPVGDVSRFLEGAVNYPGAIGGANFRQQLIDARGKSLDAKVTPFLTDILGNLIGGNHSFDVPIQTVGDLYAEARKRGYSDAEIAQLQSGEKGIFDFGEKMLTTDPLGNIALNVAFDPLTYFAGIGLLKSGVRAGAGAAARFAGSPILEGVGVLDKLKSAGIYADKAITASESVAAIAKGNYAGKLSQKGFGLYLTQAARSYTKASVRTYLGLEAVTAASGAAAEATKDTPVGGLLEQLHEVGMAYLDRRPISRNAFASLVAATYTPVIPMAGEKVRGLKADFRSATGDGTYQFFRQKLGDVASAQADERDLKTLVDFLDAHIVLERHGNTAGNTVGNLANDAVRLRALDEITADLVDRARKDGTITNQQRWDKFVQVSGEIGGFAEKSKVRMTFRPLLAIEHWKYYRQTLKASNARQMLLDVGKTIGYSDIVTTQNVADIRTFIDGVKRKDKTVAIDDVRRLLARYPQIMSGPQYRNWERYGLADATDVSVRELERRIAKLDEIAVEPSIGHELDAAERGMEIDPNDPSVGMSQISVLPELRQLFAEAFPGRSSDEISVGAGLADVALAGLAKRMGVPQMELLARVQANPSMVARLGDLLQAVESGHSIVFDLGVTPERVLGERVPDISTLTPEQRVSITNGFVDWVRHYLLPTMEIDPEAIRVVVPRGYYKEHTPAQTGMLLLDRDRITPEQAKSLNAAIGFLGQQYEVGYATGLSHLSGDELAEAIKNASHDSLTIIGLDDAEIYARLRAIDPVLFSGGFQYGDNGFQTWIPRTNGQSVLDDPTMQVKLKAAFPSKQISIEWEAVNAEFLEQDWKVDTSGRTYLEAVGRNGHKSLAVWLSHHPNAAQAEIERLVAKYAPDEYAAFRSERDAAIGITRTDAGLLKGLGSTNDAALAQRMAEPAPQVLVDAGLGAMSEPEYFPLPGGKQIAVPGGLDGTFSYWDMWRLQSQSIDPGLIPQELRKQIYTKIFRTMTGSLETDPLDNINRMVFAMLSPNTNLTDNAALFGRMRIPDMETAKKWAAIAADHRRTYNGPPDKFNSTLGYRIQQEIGIADLKTAKAGARNIRSSVSISTNQQLAQIAITLERFVENPDWFVKRANEPMMQYVERVMNATTGAGYKVTNFGVMLRNVLQHMVGTIDSHVMDMLGLGKKAPSSKKIPYYLADGSINPDVPAHLLDLPWKPEYRPGVGKAKQPMIEVYGGDYAKADAVLREQFIESGIEEFNNGGYQWFRWDPERLKLEPHQYAYPGAYKLPLQPFDEANAAYGVLAGAGYTTADVVASPFSPTKGMLYQRSGKTVKGITRVGADGTIEVGGTKNADFSTIIHEAWHVAHELMDDQTRAMLAAIGDPESLAKQFEFWVTEGKAPVKELRPLFEQARAWLIDIYRTLRGKIVDPEFRSFLEKLYKDGYEAKAQETAPIRQALDGAGDYSADIAKMYTFGGVTPLSPDELRVASQYTDVRLTVLSRITGIPKRVLVDRLGKYETASQIIAASDYSTFAAGTLPGAVGANLSARGISTTQYLAEVYRLVKGTPLENSIGEGVRGLLDEKPQAPLPDGPVAAALDAAVAEELGPLYWHVSMQDTDPAVLEDLAANQRLLQQEYPGYTIKTAPKIATLIDPVNGLEAQALTQYTTLGNWLYGSNIFSPLTRMIAWALRPMDGGANAEAARQAMFSELSKYGAKPDDVAKMLSRLSEDTQRFTIGSNKVRMFRDYTHLPAGTINDAASRVFSGKVYDAVMADGGFANVLDRASNRFIRTLHGKDDKLSTLMESMYGRYQETVPGKALRYTKVFYHIFRFLADPRWWAMNLLEADTIGFLRYGTKATFLSGDALSPQMAMQMKGHPISEKQLAGIAADLKGDVDNTFLIHRNLSGRISGAFDSQRMGNAEGVVKGALEDAMDEVVARGLDNITDVPMIRALVDQFGGDTKTWAAQLDEQLYRFDTKGVKKTVVDAAADLGWDPDTMKRMAPVMARLEEVNTKTLDSIKNAFMGNGNRTNLERLLNSYWLYWPLSYQLKAGKWLADVLTSGAVGKRSNFFGVWTYNRYREQHIDRMENDPQYAQMFNQYPSLWFAAQMLFPIYPEDLGVSLSRPVRYMGGEVGLWPKYKQAQDPFAAASAVLEMGPIYTLKLLRRIRSEFNREDATPYTYTGSQQGDFFTPLFGGSSGQ